jgi:hypothetical protein
MVEIKDSIKEAMKKDRTSCELRISRVPIKTFDFFISLSNEEFCGDYGMGLRECVNAYIELKRLKEKMLLDSNIRIEVKYV